MKRALVASAVLSLAICVLPVTSAAPGDVQTDERALAPETASASYSSRGRRPSSRDDATCGRRRRPRGITAGYRRMRARWHARAPRGLMRAWLREEVKPLVIRPAHRRERFTLLPDPETGRFDESQLAVAREAFRYHADDATTDVHPRVIDLVYRAVLRFEVPYVTLVSGYRTTRATSRHNQGRAMDVVLPGVSDRGLAAFLRRQGFAGVGIYPVSGFVHVDVRERSFFWTDSSAPGRRSRVRRMASSLVARVDRAARRRGEEPVPDLPELLAGEGEGEIVDEGVGVEPGPIEVESAGDEPST